MRAVSIQSCLDLVPFVSLNIQESWNLKLRFKSAIWHFLSKTACSVSWDSLGHEGSISCILHSHGNEGCISRPHLKETLNCNSLNHAAVTPSGFEFSLRKRENLDWDAVYDNCDK